MNHCRASFESLRRERRPRPSGASRLIGPLIVLLAMAVWPTAVLAAEVAAGTQRNAIVVYIVIILLLCAVAAGLFFASPLRRRLTGTDEGDERAVRVRQPQPEAQPPFQPFQPLQPPPLPDPAQPTLSQPQGIPRSSRSAAPEAAPQSSPWSTGDPRADNGWDPTRR